MSKSKRRILAAIGNSPAIPAEREQGPGSKLGTLELIGAFASTWVPAFAWTTKTSHSASVREARDPSSPSSSVGP